MTSDSPGNLWQSTCTEQIDDRPLDADTTVDLAIIGGGFTGVSAALAAAQAGASVCLVEAHEVGYGGSGRNVGLVNAGLWTPPDEISRTLGPEAGERLVSILASAPERVFDLIDRHEIQCEAVRNGTLHCAHAPSGLADLRARHNQQAARGAPVTLLDAEKARRLTGSPAVHGALLDTRAGTVQPLALCRGLARAAAALGARIASHTQVRRLSCDRNVWRLDCGVAQLQAKALLLATNAYHEGATGIDRPNFVPVHFFQLATEPLSTAQQEVVLPERQGCWDTALVMSSFRLDAAGRLIVGGIGNLDGAAGAVHRGWAQRKLSQLYPQLGMIKLAGAWCGRIAMTGDHLPRIVAPGPNALICYGYSGRGIGPGTTFGMAAALALLTGDASRLPVAPTEAHREAATELRAGYYEVGAALTHLVGARR